MHYGSVVPWDSQSQSVRALLLNLERFTPGIGMRGLARRAFTDRLAFKSVDCDGEIVVVSDSWGDCFAMNNPARVGVLQKGSPG